MGSTWTLRVSVSHYCLHYGFWGLCFCVSCGQYKRALGLVFVLGKWFSGFSRKLMVLLVGLEAGSQVSSVLQQDASFPA